MAQRLSSLWYAMSRMAKTEIVDIPQPYKSIVLIEVVVDETPDEVAIDQSPDLGVNDECAERCLLYFKRHIALRGTRTTTSCRAASLRRNKRRFTATCISSGVETA
jgi:hypothetical protein